MTQVKNAKSTYEREMNDKSFKKTFDKGYKEFLQSELLIAITECDQISIKNLVEEIGK